MAKEDVYGKVFELCETFKTGIENAKTLDQAKVAGITGFSMIISLVGGAIAESKNSKETIDIKTPVITRRIYHAKS